MLFGVSIDVADVCFSANRGVLDSGAIVAVDFWRFRGGVSIDVADACVSKGGVLVSDAIVVVYLCRFRCEFVS